ncbi:PucR C-terminal helix-turn-helix domain-containing protein [Parageobacillus thermantarcticus]|uniref:PucR C-terminal helix-turn-helix domain-containing protein n=1 Tax=Parageobacillus thermantarcticus TaxID=186116 RepID=A0A1I0T0T5_9BACL|nr:helix-turn-helix domain-containing protein [Parageobacillus thermantarcticus]SFA45384.1 PucR C-terminal helix-turn-helix domain-containing protein [Parageobacillus thermantarcticus]
MLERLKSYYKDAIVINERVDDIAAYEWFYTKDGDKIGIDKQRLSEQEKQLLSIFLTPIPDTDRMMNDEEMAWYSWIMHGDPTMLQHFSSHSPYYRFIHFLTKPSVANKDDFYDAINGLFPEQIIIVWEHDHRGVIIEKKQTPTPEPLPFAEIVDTLSTDFYITLHLFIGQIHRYSEHLYESFCHERNCFQLAQTYMPKQTVYQMEDIIPLLLIHHHSELETVKKSLPSLETLDDEWLHIIKTFFQCDLNVSLAAKKLYMHRNSLQYRIDKFIEKTGIDIKHFKGAVAVYLAILLQEYVNH